MNSLSLFTLGYCYLLLMLSNNPAAASTAAYSDMESISSQTIDTLNNNSIVQSNPYGSTQQQQQQQKPRNRGHSLCEVPGCTRLSRKGPTSERAKYCTRHGGGRPCQYPGCRVAARGLLGYCYKHRRFGKLLQSTGLLRQGNGRTLHTSSSSNNCSNNDNNNRRRRRRSSEDEHLSTDIINTFPVDIEKVVMCSNSEHAAAVNHSSLLARLMCSPHPPQASHTGMLQGAIAKRSYLQAGGASIEDLFRNPCPSGMNGLNNINNSIIPLQVMRF